MNCNKGDLAVVVSSAFEENIGLFVEVLGPWLPGQCGIDSMFDDGHLWRCKAKGEIRYTSVLGEVVCLSEGPIPDRCLRPIRPGQKASDKKVIREIDKPQFA
jgi:hypothetical protein